MSQTFTIAASLVALWPVWVWCACRLADRSDDPLGVAALVAAILFAAISAQRNSRHVLYCTAGHLVNGPDGQVVKGAPKHVANGADRHAPKHLGHKDNVADLWTSIATFIFFCLYALTAPILPMLIRAAFAVTALALVISPACFSKRLHLPTYGLLLLSLPLVATMQFYLGYPLRLLVGEFVRAIVACAGYDVALRGTDLLWNTHVVGIDPACSGIRMLWTAFLVCFIYAGVNKLSNARTAALAAGTLAVALTCNVFRAVMLFMLEVIKTRTEFVEPSWIHSGIGIALFGFSVIVIAWLANKLYRPAAVDRLACLQHNYGAAAASAHQRTQMQVGFKIVMAGITVACFAPHLVPNNAQAATHTPNLEFPKTYNGRQLKQLPLTAQEKTFAASFPGRLGKFTDGPEQLILRWVTKPTRQLHPSEDCFRGLGYTIHSLPKVHDNTTNTTWGAFEATGGNGVKLLVRERIVDAANNSFADVSAWYWAAILGKSHGPWLSTTVATELH